MKETMFIVLAMLMMTSAGIFGWRLFYDTTLEKHVAVSNDVNDILDKLPEKKDPPRLPPEFEIEQPSFDPAPKPQQSDDPERSQPPAPKPAPADEPERQVREQDINEKKPVSEKKMAIADSVRLDVPFIVQAPYADWGMPYAEACEEASVMMVHNYYQNDRDALSQQEMKDAIDSIISWGDATFGHFDSSASDTAKYFTEKLGYDPGRVDVVYDFTIDDIKVLLNKGVPAIIPTAGRDMGNQYFQPPGPLYHMAVIIGYEDGDFITHDPGTKRGAAYRYNQETLYNAIHELTDTRENIRQGRKAMLIVMPEQQT